MKIRKTEEFLNYFKNRDVEYDYLKDHVFRYEFLFKKIDELLNKTRRKKFRILDLGPSFQTEVLRVTLPQFPVDSLGFFDKRFMIRPKDKHYEYNLNDAQHKNKWLKIKKYDMIIMAELIEHLYTAPSLVLKCIATWLNKGGYLIIQTPNAISLNRRLKMILGRHPYDPIRETQLNPGHFREYTLKELVSEGKKCDFTLTSYTVNNYFRHKGLKGILYNSFCKILPNSFRDGITICFQKK